MLTFNSNLGALVTAIVQGCRKDGLKESVVRRVLTQHSNAHSQQAAHLLSRSTTKTKSSLMITTAKQWLALKVDDHFHLAPHLAMTCQAGCGDTTKPIRALRAVSETRNQIDQVVCGTYETTFLCNLCHAPLELYDTFENCLVEDSQMGSID